MFVLDTDVLRNLRMEKKSPLVLAWIEETAAADLAATVITIAEIQYGIERQMPSDPVTLLKLRDGSMRSWKSAACMCFLSAYGRLCRSEDA